MCLITYGGQTQDALHKRRTVITPWQLAFLVELKFSENHLRGVKNYFTVCGNRNGTLQYVETWAGLKVCENMGGTLQ